MKYPCPKCNGSGKDYLSTAKSLGIKNDGQITEELIDKVRYKTRHFGGIHMCWSCNGNGTDNWAYFCEIKEYENSKRLLEVSSVAE